jgi:UDP-N-acetyl-D-glucosamine dehydrogenase
VTTESPAFEIMRLLREQGAQLSYSDPWVPHCPSLGLVSSAPSYAHAAYVLVTDHAAFDYARLAHSGAWILDTRGAFARRGLHGPKILTV